MTDLREAWRELLVRRRALAASLAPYGELLERWTAWTPPRQPAVWSPQSCREAWARGEPLTALASPPLDAAAVEDLLGEAMEDVAAVDASRAPALQRLAGAWGFAKLRCPLCGVEGTKDLNRLQAEGEDAGYAISGCRACRGYLKELDRRERWNGGPPVLEDWASPHLDVAARRAGFSKPLPALLDLASAR